jgi:hypothetical protein
LGVSMGWVQVGKELYKEIIWEDYITVILTTCEVEGIKHMTLFKDSAPTHLAP